MANCAASGCRNSTRKAVKMNTFPRQPQRRNMWIKNCITLGGMNANFVPLEKSVLCEYHFTADMWEKVRVDGKKKLKCDALPTIFGDLVFQVKGKVDKGPVKAENIIAEEILVQLDPLTKDVEILPIRNIETQATSLIKGIQEPSCSTQIFNTAEAKRRQSTTSSFLQNIKYIKESSCSKQVSESEKVQLRQSKPYSILRSIKKPQVQGTVDPENLFHEGSFEEVSTKHLNETSSSNLQSEHIRPSTVQKGTSTGIHALNQNDYSDDDFAQEEKDLLNLHQQFLTTSFNTNLNLDVNLRTKYEDLQKKYEKVLKLYQKSERLRIIMKKRYKQKHRAWKQKVKKLEKTVLIAKRIPLDIRKILNEEQIKLLSSEYKKLPKWCDQFL